MYHTSVDNFCFCERREGRDWDWPHDSGNDLYFSASQNSSSHRSTLPHLHLSYNYDGTLSYVGLTPPSRQHIYLFQYDRWIDDNQAHFSKYDAILLWAFAGISRYWRYGQRP